MKAFSEIAKPALILTAICLVISLALAGTNVLTADAIAQNNEKEAYETRIQVLEGADNFEPVVLEPFTAEDGSKFVEMVKASNGIGYVATTTAKGYGGEMTVMTGFDNDGNIVGVSILSSRTGFYRTVSWKIRQFIRCKEQRRNGQRCCRHFRGHHILQSRDIGSQLRVTGFCGHEIGGVFR